MRTNAGRAMRVLRMQRGWTQSQLGARIGVSRETISRAERGGVNGLTLATVDSIATVLGASVSLQIRWRGEQLDRLLDAAHAALQQALASALVRLGWEVRAEVSFNHYGDRGRIDLMAYHPMARILLVVEIKSALGDLQDTIGRIDVKARLGRRIAGNLGWSHVGLVVPVLVIGDTRLARRVVGQHGALFARFDVRGRSALAWLRRPDEPMPNGLLWFASRPYSRHVTARRVRPASDRSRSHGA